MEQVKNNREAETFQNLYPALVQCFVLICTGYISGRTGMLSFSQAKGIGAYVTKFALPALLFQSMCSLNFSQVNWMFLISLLIAKTIVFLIVVVFTLLLTRRKRLAKGALYGIFATQTNDFSLGYPIVSAVYSTSNPDFISYLYLIAPISLIFLNPVGFALLEVQKWRDTPRRTSWHQALTTIILHVVCNPIVFMSVLGTAGNFVFSQKVPNVLREVFQILGDSFSATALFFLGHSLLGKIQHQTQRAFVVTGLLIAAKMFLLPLVCRLSTQLLLHKIESVHNDTGTDLTSFSFLYGTFPSAPTVFLYASQYNIATATIGTSLVVCTLVAAPIIFVSAKMITIMTDVTVDYMTVLHRTETDCSITTIVFSFWVLAVFVLGRRYKSVSHQFTLCVIFSQVLTAVGVTLHYYMSVNETWAAYLQFILLVHGSLSARLWTAVVAVKLCLLHVYDLEYVTKVKKWFFLAGFCVPVALTTFLVLLFLPDFKADVINMDLHLLQSIPQLAVKSTVLIITLLIIIISMVILNRHDINYLGPPSPYTPISDSEARRHYSSYYRLSAPSPGPHPRTASIDAMPRQRLDLRKISSDDREPPVTDTAHLLQRSDNMEVVIEEDTENLASGDMAEGDPSTTEHRASTDDALPLGAVSGPTQDEAHSLEESIHEGSQDPMQSIECQQDQVEEDEMAVTECRDQHQVFRHVVLILILFLSSATELSACMMRLVEGDSDSLRGIRVVIEFLSSVMTYGQGIFTFLVFGLDTEVVVSPFYRRLRKLLLGAAPVKLPDREELGAETVEVCVKFIGHHRDACRAAIVTSRRYRLRMYVDVFDGTELVDWLIEVGLANDRSEGVAYGRHLLLGQVIEHVQRQQFFHDLHYLYQFTENHDHFLHSPPHNVSFRPGTRTP